MVFCIREKICDFYLDKLGGEIFLIKLNCFIVGWVIWNGYVLVILCYK